MDAYLVPVGTNDYEIYCEPGVEAEHPVTPEVSTWQRRLAGVFRDVMAALERERAGRAARRSAPERPTWFMRVRDRVMGWLTERVAEQRLLWRLRATETATVHAPDDLAVADVMVIVRKVLAVDGRRHRNWFVVDAVGGLIAWPFSFVPGPNVILYYFVFRVVGHYLSWTGARRGLEAVTWTVAMCPPLTDLRRLPALPPGDRTALAHDVAHRLGLEHIDTFAERMSLGRA